MKRERKAPEAKMPEVKIPEVKIPQVKSLRSKRPHGMLSEEKTHRIGFILFFSILVFLAMVINIIVASLLTYLLIRLGLLNSSMDAVTYDSSWIFYLFLISLPIGAVLSWLISKIPLKPVHDLVKGMNRLAGGDFSARVSPGKVMKNLPAAVEIADSFNKMAQELEGTELLRSDFINNFSHEFKTPIVSIAGFAKLLNRGNLSQEQQREYLQVIEEESLRLSYMATNVLNLTKVENQTILTDVTRFNLSEQIRSCVLLLENKWSRKDLDIELLLNEHDICANEELLKQVWINLLDHAVTFTPRGGMIQIMVEASADIYQISILNTGSEIQPEQQEKIFHKFYQADESHAAEGNGVGLAIVKKIVDLHGGQIQVSSEDDVTVFAVTLPKDN